MIANEHWLALIAARVGVTVPLDSASSYVQILRDVDAMCEQVLQAPDSYLDKYPRSGVHWPSAEMNTYCGWAWKANVRGASTGLLAGKTLCLKDNICLAGVPLTFGTKAIDDYTPSIDAELVKRALDSGAIIVGKATCEAFSHGPGSITSFYGPVENPHARGFTTGGSSSGCGALVGGGLVDLAMGGDQGGSVRIPASFCGIVGLKPTFGLIPYTGVLSSEWGIDTVGPMTRTVEDCALLLQSVAGFDDIDDRMVGAPLQSPAYHAELLEARASGLKGLRIGVLKEGFDNPHLDARVEQLVRLAVQDMSALGAEVVDVSAPMHANAAPINYVLSKFGSGPTRLGRQHGSRGLAMGELYEKLLPWTQERLDLAGRYVIHTCLESEYGWVNYPLAYPRAVNQSRALRDQYDKLFDDVDVLVMPTVMQPARRHAPLEGGPAVWQYWSPGITANTAPFNATRHPALSIPVGTTTPIAADIQSASDKELKLPVGLQLVGRRFDDAMVMRVGDAWERAVDWKTRHIM